MLPTIPWCPFFSLRFTHSRSSLQVIFSVKLVHYKCLNKSFFLRVDVRVQLGPHAFMSWGSFPF
jgi:hypothetical protein